MKRTNYIGPYVTHMDQKLNTQTQLLPYINNKKIYQVSYEIVVLRNLDTQAHKLSWKHRFHPQIVKVNMRAIRLH